MENQLQHVNDPVNFLNSEENQAVEKFISELGLENAFGKGITVTKEEAIKYMIARKFDVGRAINLFHTSRALRQQYDLVDFDICKDPLHSELRSGKFTVLSGRCSDSSQICLFYAHKHFPKLVDHVTVLRSLVFQLDCVLKCHDTQRNGISFIYNMKQSSYQNFDYSLAEKILHLLKGGYPARLKHIYVVCAPLWFRVTFSLFSTFLGEKLRDRVEIVPDVSELYDYIPKSDLPRDMNGVSDHDHIKWIQECTKTYNQVEMYLTEKQIYGNEDFNKVAEKNKVSNGTYETKESVNQILDETDKPPSKPLPPPPEDNELFSDEEEEGNSLGQNAFSIAELIEHMKNVGRKGIQKEYDELRSLPPSGSFESTLYTANLRKNRYNNILAFEESRVHLHQINGDPYSDYINANYLGSITTEKKFICTQGPMPQTYFDFWRMIWEHSVAVIIMITKCAERGRGKCGQYWPEQERQTCTYGHLVVTNLECDVKADFTTSLFDLTNSMTQSSRQVYHVQFTSWPDFGVPSSAAPILDVIEYTELHQMEASKYLKNASTQNSDFPSSQQFERSGEYQSLAPCFELNANGESNNDDLDMVKHSPIVVHCSAGVGRTGTYCCLSNCIDQIKSTETVDIYNTVKKIRDQRAFSVQTPEQYEFGYIAVIEYLIRQKLKHNQDTSDLEDFLREFKGSQIGSDSE